MKIKKCRIVNKNLKTIILFFFFLILPLASYSQKDVTQFLDIPVDGYKPEMLQKIKSKGFTANRNKEDILNGEFNGTDVNIVIATNNNKVWRVAVLDANSTDETNIKIRFNNLIKQFVNNERYSKEADSTIAKYTIPKDENISYEITVNKKRYEAVFYQKSLKYDSLAKENEILVAKEKLTDKEKERVGELILEMFRESMNSLNKQVWFMISENYGKYSIVIYYDNEFNKANGNGL
ncbi:hypothetical protein [Flavobacterium sp.]|jgi:hypothetical protein|uniref:hypothetical protein n=1 Tax=Flavobacterium sp. TaxID=239 RepID=UPI0025EB6B15|nr:hypothetical protein [Flavobacterium sp.]